MRRLLTVLVLTLSLGVIAQENYSKINLDTRTFEEFAVFGDTLDNYRVYFTGENHQFASFNSKLELKLLDYLNQTQGVEHFIFEQSPAVGYLIESIIVDNNSSNSKFFRDVFYEPFYQLIKDVEDLNDSLPSSNKIHIHGIDVERFPYFSVYALNRIVDSLDNNVHGGVVFEQIQALGSSEYEMGEIDMFYADEQTGGFMFGEVSAWGSLRSIIIEARAHKDSLTPVLGKDAEIFYSILDGLEQGREWYITEKKGDVKSPILRERFMQDEFERIYRKFPDAKFYGQFGRCHLHKDKKAKKCYDYYMNSIANRITEIDSTLDRRVMVIPIYYSKGKEKMDREIVEDLNLDEKFEEDDEAFIIDLAYKNGDHPIVGFYDKLPFVIVSNKPIEKIEENEFDWNTEIFEFHLGASYGYSYFSGIKTLNAELVNAGSIGFTNKMTMYDFSADFFTLGNLGNRFHFTYFPEITNNDRFDLKAWRFSMGTYYTFGNKWVMGAAGLDYGYGQFSLTEDLDNTIPNLIQGPGGNNLIIYRNDAFTLDPNLEFRITLPYLSLNLKAGYAFDVSGKRWKLDGKMKEFTRSSWTSPYIQVGVSLNWKEES